MLVAIEDFALPHALEAVPEMDVETERLAAHSQHWVMPCLWAGGGDFDAFDGALDDDPTVEAVVGAVEYESEKFYQIHWSDEVERHLNAGLGREGVLLHAETTHSNWRLSVRFSTHEQFDRFRGSLTEDGIAFRLGGLTRAPAPDPSTGGLSTDQRDALVAAVAEGYFAIPREATMEEVAGRLDISTQAASERLRRGVERFVETMLLAPEERRRPWQDE